MALQTTPGGFLIPLGPGSHIWNHANPILATSITLDATNEALIMIGQVITSDGGSHTIDTTGSSNLGWVSGSATFVNGGTTVKVGLANVLTTAGPPARAVHASDVITFDVSKSLIGGGGGITASSWHNHVPDAGSKTIANGDLIAFAVQMIARGGVDTLQVSSGSSGASIHRPQGTAFIGGSYVQTTGVPNITITFSDGAYGWFYGAEIFSAMNGTTFNSGGATKEYGQLFNFLFPIKIYGIYGWIDPDNDADIVLYSDPLGTPVAERTVSLDANTATDATVKKFVVLFSSPYLYAANTNIAAVYKPGASNISVYSKTLNNAAHRISMIGGTSSYGVSRASGAFANVGSSLEHFYIGLIAGAFDDGAGGGGRAVQINATSLVA